ncbi:hypothetical protein GCM10027020_29560 [Nocardioides salsibiostraticola]
MTRPARHHAIAAALAVAGLTLAGCSGTEDAAQNITNPRPDATSANPSASESADAEDPETGEASAPSEPGPFAVGRRTEQVVDASREDRTFSVEVWYPSDTNSAPTPYELIPGVAFDSALSTTGSPASAEGPFPVVVFSHGSGGLRQQSASIVETVASHGFVVVAPDHPGNTAIDQLLGTQTSPKVTATNRVLDVGVVLDRLESQEIAAGLVDIEKVAVMGHSFGGFTALAAAGGYDGIPGDPRVDAIVPLAPYSELLSNADLESINVPMLIVTGSDDRTTPVENQSTRPVSRSTGDSRLVLIDGAGHSSVTDVCAIAEAIDNGGDAVPDGAAEAVRAQVGGACDDPAALARAFDVTEHYSVGFLRSVLLDDSRYDEVGPIEGATVRQ